jgi:hypothetical protein
MEMNGRVYRKDKKEIMGFVCLFFLFNKKCLSDLGKMDGNLRRSSS